MGIARDEVSKMGKMAEIRPDEYLGRKTLILGEVNTGKTTLTGRILEALLRSGDFEGRIAIVDMAPEIPEALAQEKGIAGVGGKLMPPQGHDVLYLGGHLAPPRLSSKTEAEAIEKARQNRRTIEGLFRKLGREPREILLLNDVTLYLQAGTAEDLIRRVDRAGTVIANGYWGGRLGGGTLTEREKAETAKLKAYFERMGRVLLLERWPLNAPEGQRSPFPGNGSR